MVLCCDPVQTQYRFKGVTVMPLQFARIQPPLRSVRFWLLVVSTFLFVSATLERAEAQENNNVVAVANAEPITRKTLADESVKRFGQDVLDNMVNRQLIMQECVNRGVEVTNQEVSDEIRRLTAIRTLWRVICSCCKKSVISPWSVQS